MDLDITLANGTFSTSINAKPLALHLYIPPISCHAPGVYTGLIQGHFHRIYSLCSRQEDITSEIHLFYQRLLDRGYSLDQLIPLFLTAEEKAINRRTHHLQTPPPSTQCNDATNDIFLHLQYHPDSPSSRTIQDLWRQHVWTPPNKTPFSALKNRQGHMIPVRKLTIAYSRAQNLGNILSYRKLHATIASQTSTIPLPNVTPTHHQTTPITPSHRTPVPNIITPSP